MTNSACVQQVNKLIKWGETILQVADAAFESEYPEEAPNLVSERLFNAWRTSCQALILSLGEKGTPWRNIFDGGINTYHQLIANIGNIEGIKYALENGLFSSLEDIVRADLFSDMLDQADYLFSEKFNVGATVTARVVLEEHLKKKCIKHNCTPKKPRPMLGDYIAELAKNNHIDSIGINRCYSVSKIAGAAAHTQTPILDAHVQSMLKDVRDLLFLYPN